MQTSINHQTTFDLSNLNPDDDINNPKVNHASNRENASIVTADNASMQQGDELFSMEINPLSSLSMQKPNQTEKSDLLSKESDHDKQSSLAANQTQSQANHHESSEHSIKLSM